ncbi:ImmA/IrrE family metallo-endopeptidase [Mycobacterium sp. 23]|uniref:ImmA/IrrE family metallo-endopeptidase n=1 Tax=Mycobacterium sp. 23 TaxID=3400424 RepID=UPI003AADA398
MTAFGKSSATIDWALPRLRMLFQNRYPEAAEVAHLDARAAVARMEDVVFIEDPRPRVRLCQIDATYDPEPPTIRWRPLGSRRDNFTLLHEVAHHLLAFDEEWCFDVAPALGEQTSKYAEESIADAFAADVLIDEETASSAFASGVTSQACVDLYLNTAASATACLARALSQSGDRLVLLTDLEGRVWFGATTGEPYNPGRGTIQPAIASAAEHALRTDGSYRFSGGDGIRYRSGSAFTAVRIDVTVEGGLVFAIVEQAQRTRYDYDTYELNCPECDEDLTSADLCQKCREPKCVRCRACSCPRQRALCDICFLELPIAISAKGIRVCDNCS